MDESVWLSRIENIINNKSLRWTLCFIGEDQAALLSILNRHLSRGASSTGEGKKFVSGFSYWGIGPTIAWKKACDDNYYHVMRESISSFSELWDQTRHKLELERQIFHYVSLGIGTGEKDRSILSDLNSAHLKPFYFPIDMSQEMLWVGIKKAIVNVPIDRRKVLPVQIDFSRLRNVTELKALLHQVIGDEPILFSLLGNTLANFDDDEELLRTLSQLIRPQDRLLLELACTDSLSEEAQQEAEEEYSSVPPFRSFAISSLIQYTDLHANPDTVTFISSVEGERAIKIKAIYQNNTDTTKMINLADGRSPVLFPPQDSIRLYLSRKYTDDGIDDLVKKCGFSSLYSTRFNFNISDNRFKFGMRLMLLSAKESNSVQSLSSSVFISCSSVDQEFAERLRDDLQGNGARVWFAPHDLPIGARIRPAIDESIRLYDKLLLVLSETSVSSQWVEQEVETALAKERESEGKTVLFPVRIDEAVMEIKAGWPALLKNTRNVGDFTNWKSHDSYQKAFDRLLRDLKAEA